MSKSDSHEIGARGIIEVCNSWHTVSNSAAGCGEDRGGVLKKLSTIAAKSRVPRFYPREYFWNLMFDFVFVSTIHLANNTLPTETDAKSATRRASHLKRIDGHVNG